MTLGEVNQEVTYNKSPDEAFMDVHRALSMIGEVKNLDKTILTIEGTSRHGFQSVKLKVKITPQGNVSSISIKGFSDDIWAWGARNSIKRLLEAMDNLENPDYKPSRTGMKPLSMALTLVAFIALLLLVIVALMYLPAWVMVLFIMFGLGILVYSIVAKIRFGK